MGCDISGEQLWSWIDRDAPELEEHLAVCEVCRARAAIMREEIGLLALEGAEEIPLPDQVGPYMVRRLLGEGGQALVYEAEQPSPRRLVALKVLKGGYLVNKTRIRHFRRETQTLARLNHPAIATIYEAGRTEEGLYYFAMELVDGSPLGKYVKENKLGKKEVLSLFLKLCEAIQYAHDQSVIHRDLKPSNILVDSRGQPKVLDFGLARLFRSDVIHTVTETKDGRVEGTPRYMSPEQAMGKLKKIDARSDVYTLGVILYEMLTGEPPNDISEMTLESIKTICEDIPRRPSSINPGLKGDLDAILLKALEKQPRRRYQSVKELADDVSRYLDGEPILAKTPNTLYFLRRKIAKRRLWVAGAFVAIIATVFVVYRAGQPVYDPVIARFRILNIQCALFRDGATDLSYFRARQAVNRYPGLAEATLVQAHAYCLRQEQNSAIVALMKGLERDPSTWSYRMMLAEIQPSYKQALPHRVSNGDWTPRLASSPDAWYLRSFATLDIREALEWNEEALQRDPRHEFALAAVAHLSEITGDVEGALKTARLSIDLGYRPIYWRQYRATLYAENARYQEALAECNDWIAATPDAYNPYKMRAKLYRRLNRFADSERDFTGAIERAGSDHPMTAWLFAHRGTVRWLLDRKDEAIADYQKAFDFLNHATFVNARLYIFLRELGRTADANASLSDARRVGDVDPWLESVFQCIEGTIAPRRLIAAARADGDSIRVCEACYYAGETALLGGSEVEARRCFRMCIGTGARYDPNELLDMMSEYELAEWRLAQMNE